MASESEAVKALNQFSDKLSGLKNVVGLGVVSLHEKLEDAADDMAVAVYVRKKLPKSELPKDQLIPRTLKFKINNRLIEVNTKVIEQGEAVLEQMPTKERL